MCVPREVAPDDSLVATFDAVVDEAVPIVVDAVVAGRQITQVLVNPGRGGVRGSEDSSPRRVGEIAVAKGKKLHDKREAEMKKTVDKEMRQQLKENAR